MTTLALQYELARMAFDDGDYANAARQLADVVAEAPNEVSARLLLARAYYHSAQLTRAEATLREVIEQAPAEAYAHLMLGRTLQRQSRHADAAPHLRLAAAMGLDAA